MLADADEGIVIGVELLQPDNGMEEMWRRVPEKVVELLIEAQVRPAEIVFNSDRMTGLLASVCKQAGVALNTAESLDALEEARDSMEEHLIDPPAGFREPPESSDVDWQPLVTTAAPFQGPVSHSATAGGHAV